MQRTADMLPIRGFRPRVIPALLVKDGLLCKPVRFDRPKYVGDPRVTVKLFNDKGADELFLLDISAHSRGSPDFDLLQEIAGECFMPLGYGGAVRSLEHARRLFGLGMEKIVVGAAAVEAPELLTRIAEAFGTQAVVACIDVRKTWLGRYRVYTHGGRRDTGCHPVELAKCLQRAGVGEILLQSIDREGTGQGYDTELIASVASAVDIPLVALGGAGRLKHFRDAVDVGASAVAAGSMFILNGPHRAVLVTYPDADELDRLFGARQS